MITKDKLYKILKNFELVKYKKNVNKKDVVRYFKILNNEKLEFNMGGYVVNKTNKGITISNGVNFWFITFLDNIIFKKYKI